MFWRGSFFFRLLAALLLIGILVAAGVAVYRTGFSQGYVQGVAVAGDETLPDRGGAPFFAPGYYPGYYRPHFGFGFFPFFPLFGFLFFGLLLFWLLGALFRPRPWGWHRGGYGYPPHWGPPPEEKAPPSGETGEEEKK